MFQRRRAPIARRAIVVLWLTLAPPALPALPALAAETAETSAGGPSDWSVRWADGVRVERNDGAARIFLGGRLLLDAGIIHADADLAVPGKEPGKARTLARLRQFRLVAKGQFEKSFFKIETEFAGSDAEFTDVFLGASGLGPMGTVKGGHMKEPFSLEQQTSRRWMTFTERSLPNALVIGRNTGGSLEDTALGDRLRWRVGVFCDTSEFAKHCDDDVDLGFRLTGLPALSEDGANLTAVGVSYVHQFRNNRSITFSKLDPFLTNKFLGIGTIRGVRAVDRIGTEAAWVHGPLSIQAEYIHAFLDRTTGRGNLDFWGLTAEASWLVTGEHRPYSKRTGAFDRIVPRKSFAPSTGDWGAFQLATRVSYLDLDDRDISGGRATDLTLGFNWFLTSTLRFTLNYVFGQVRGPGDVHIVQARFQIAL